MATLTDDQLAAYRTVADTPADAIMQTVIAHDAQQQLNRFFATLAYNDSFATADLPAPVREFVEQASQLPAWYDADAVQRGEEVFTKYGLEICLILICKALPECYLCWRGAEVLFRTGRLMEQRGDLSRLTRRIAETLQFVINVMAESGTTPHGKGIVTAQKIRIYISQNTALAWDEQRLGKPLNQEDLALTLTTFSASIVAGLEQLHIRLSDEERAGYMHAWRVVGHFMGVDAAFLDVLGQSNSYEATLGLQADILRAQAGSSVANQALTRSCVDFLEYIVPAKRWKGVAPIAMEFFLGKEHAALLGVKPAWFSWNTIRFALVYCVLWLVGFVQQHTHFLQGVISALARDLMQGLTLYFNDYKQVRFDIPPSLRGAWGLETPKKNSK
jgi:hypothetical protein